MKKKIDCMGMACPLPVISAKKAIETFTEDGTLSVKVDNDTAVQNLTRLGEHNGFEVTFEKNIRDKSGVLPGKTEFFKYIQTECFQYFFLPELITHF